jgi:hypothetical protein
VTYTIAHYPVHLIDVVRVANGSRITIRPTLPQDSELQREFFHTLSVRSRYFRFMTHLNELPDTLAQRFASLDYPQSSRPSGRGVRGRARDHDRRGEIRCRRS